MIKLKYKIKHNVNTKLLSLTFLIFFLWVLHACNIKQKEEPPKPNIIFIMSDDHAYQAVSAYGYGLNNTPNIDRLAKEGAIFTRACVNNSLCAPSRAAVITGKHSFINGKVDNTMPYNWDQDNFPKELQKAGYQTALFGKIHLDGTPQGFDYSAVLPGQGVYYNPNFLVNGEKKQFQGYCTEIITNLVMDWLKNKRIRNKPFCLLYNQKAPHRWWQPAPKYLNLFDDRTFEPPLNFYDDYNGRGTAIHSQKLEILKILKWGRDLKLMVNPDGDSTRLDSELRRLNDEQMKSWMEAYESKNQEFLRAHLKGKELDLWKFNRFLKDYLRCIQSVDDGVGELLDYLEETGLDENTIVVYTSDQGFFLGEHGLLDKRFMYKESFRTPLLMRYPKEIKPGTKINKLVQNIDYAATFLDYAGIKIPTDIQGKSFRKLVSGESSDFRDFAYYTYYEHPTIYNVKRHYGIATQRYKLIHFYYDIDEWELYDLEKDSSEMKNVYNDPKYVDIQRMMHEKLKIAREKYGDSEENEQKYRNIYLEWIKNNESNNI